MNQKNSERYLNFQLSHYGIVGEIEPRQNFDVFNVEAPGEPRRTVYRSKGHLHNQKEIVANIVDNGNAYANIVDGTRHLKLQILQGNDTDPHLFIVEDQDGGRLLDDILARDKDLPEAAVVKYVLNILEAMAPFHDAGFSYGACNPQYLRLVETAASGKILKLGGLFKMHGQDKPVSIDYCPEFYPGIDAADTDISASAADVYGVGMLAYRMLLGRDAYSKLFPESGRDGKASGSSGVNWKRIHADRSRFPEIRSINREIAPEVANAIQRMQLLSGPLHFAKARDAHEELTKAWRDADVRRKNEELEEQTKFSRRTPPGTPTITEVKKDKGRKVFLPLAALAASLIASASLAGYYKLVYQPRQHAVAQAAAALWDSANEAGGKVDGELKSLRDAGIERLPATSKAREGFKLALGDRDGAVEALNAGKMEPAEFISASGERLDRLKGVRADFDGERKDIDDKVKRLASARERLVTVAPSDDQEVVQIGQELVKIEGSLKTGQFVAALEAIEPLQKTADVHIAELTAAMSSATEAKDALGKAMAGSSALLEAARADEQLLPKQEALATGIAEADRFYSDHLWSKASEAYGAAGTMLAALSGEASDAQGQLERIVASLKELSAQLGQLAADGDAKAKELLSAVDETSKLSASGQSKAAIAKGQPLAEALSAYVGDLVSMKGDAEGAIASAEDAMKKAQTASATPLGEFTEAVGLLDKARAEVAARGFTAAKALASQAQTAFAKAEELAAAAVSEFGRVTGSVQSLLDQFGSIKNPDQEKIALFSERNEAAKNEFDAGKFSESIASQIALAKDLESALMERLDGNARAESARQAAIQAREALASIAPASFPEFGSGEKRFGDGEEALSRGDVNDAAVAFSEAGEAFRSVDQAAKLARVNIEAARRSIDAARQKVEAGKLMDETSAGALDTAIASASAKEQSGDLIAAQADFTTIDAALREELDRLLRLSSTVETEMSAASAAKSASAEAGAAELAQFAEGEQAFQAAVDVRDRGELDKALEGFKAAKTSYSSATELAAKLKAETTRIITDAQTSLGQLGNFAERTDLESRLNTCGDLLAQGKLAESHDLALKIKADLEQVVVKIGETRKQVEMALEQAGSIRDSIDAGWAESSENFGKGETLLAEAKQAFDTGVLDAAMAKAKDALVAFEASKSDLEGLAGQNAAAVTKLEELFKRAAAVKADALEGFASVSKQWEAAKSEAISEKRLASVQAVETALEGLIAEVASAKPNAESQRNAILEIRKEIAELGADPSAFPQFAELEVRFSDAEKDFASEAYVAASEAYRSLIAPLQDLFATVGKSLLACPTTDGMGEFALVEAGTIDTAQLQKRKHFREDILPFLHLEGGQLSVGEPFCLLQGRVTVAQFKEFLRTRPEEEQARVRAAIGESRAGNSEMTQLSLDDARNYATWYASTVAEGARLPTGAELVFIMSQPAGEGASGVDVAKVAEWTDNFCDEKRAMGFVVGPVDEKIGLSGSCRLAVSNLNKDVSFRLVAAPRKSTASGAANTEAAAPAK